MGSSGIRLRISLLVAVLAVSANVHFVVNGAYDDVSTHRIPASGPDDPPVGVSVAHGISSGRLPEQDFAVFGSGPGAERRVY